MDTFDPDIFELKFKIADAATDLYAENERFLIKDVAERVELEPAEIFNYFPNKKAILEFYYASLVFRYEMMIDEIENFESYTLSEKLSNFAFSSFDMLQEKQAFVEATFEKLILQSFTKTDYEKEIERLIRQFLEKDPNISMSSTLVLHSYFYAFLRWQYLELIKFWLNDDSEGHELTLELTDKLTNVLQELMYNAILDKGFDLAKFAVNNKKAFLSNIPIIKQIYSKIEIR